MRVKGNLYRIHRAPHGVYFGLHDPASGRIRTERTEQAARAVAQEEMQIELIGEEEISHEEWLRRTGREVDLKIAPQPASARPVHVYDVERDALEVRSPVLPTKPIPAQSESDDALVMQQPGKNTSCFATDGIIIPPQEPDVLDHDQLAQLSTWQIYRADQS